MLFTSTLSASLFALPFAHAIVLEKLTAPPHGWSYASKPSQSQSISFNIGLQQQNIDQLESLLAAVSTPGSPSYGKYLDKDEVDALLAPSNQTFDAVTSWLKAAGINTTSVDGEWIKVQTDVATANALLSADFLNYEDESGASKLRTMQYSVPDDLSANIDMIYPTTFFGRTKIGSGPLKLKKRQPLATTRREPLKAGNKDVLLMRQTPAQINASCLLHTLPKYVTIGPDCFKTIYNISYTPDPASGSRIGFGSFLNESAQYADLSIYEQHFGIPQQSFNVTLINGGVNTQNNASRDVSEADLDVQNIIGISHPLPVEEFITGGSPPFVPNIDEPTDNENEPYLDYYNYLLSQPNSALPQVISNSYGEPEETVPELYAKRVCNMIGLMGLRGITVLESSGDTGVGAGCKSNDGTNSTQFSPQFPGTCPYLTAVGGTQSLEPEVAWDASSGGFSNYFGRAWYQQDAVTAYLDDEISAATKTYYETYTNFSGRGFPDVAAHSLTPDFLVVFNTLLRPSGGTSAASPLWAGIVGLLNDARLRANKPAMGFLNPWLYTLNTTSSSTSGLTDITMGGSVGCNGVNGQTGANVTGGGIVPFASWNATVGWDPVTGLGVPDFGDLVEKALDVVEGSVGVGGGWWKKGGWKKGGLQKE